MKLSQFSLPSATIAVAMVAGVYAFAQQPPADAAKRQGDVITQAPASKAVAAIKGTGITGSAELVERKQGTGTVVDVTVTVTGLTAGQHGVHLHAIGKCDPDFAAAGGHFDPGPAGNTDPDANHPYHMGDLPNLDAAAGSAATLKAVTTRVTVSPGPLSVFDADGTAIIIHGNPDKGVTGEPKSGVSGGPRVACGVFTK